MLTGTVVTGALIVGASVGGIPAGLSVGNTMPRGCENELPVNKTTVPSTMLIATNTFSPM